MSMDADDPIIAPRDDVFYYPSGNPDYGKDRPTPTGTGPRDKVPMQTTSHSGSTETMTTVATLDLTPWFSEEQIAEVQRQIDCHVSAAVQEALQKEQKALDQRIQREAWSFIRRVLLQGQSQQMDYMGGKYVSYEEYSARIDEAARERLPEFREMFLPHVQETE